MITRKLLERKYALIAALVVIFFITYIVYKFNTYNSTALDDYSDTVEIKVKGESLSVPTNAIAFQDETHGFAFQMESRFMGTAYYNIYKTTDGGKNWLAITNEISTGGGAVEYILFNEEGHILCHFEIGTGGWSDTIISKDGGFTWKQHTQEEEHW
ncbi:MAG: hypothetical protein GX129_12145 [Clostridiales bacterium]|jgi:photosystem II stability/assembly factor-like uncharacterized protein|nr:hypothetical protein [Clostridiales bacterium]